MRFLFKDGANCSTYKRALVLYEENIYVWITKRTLELHSPRDYLVCLKCFWIAQHTRKQSTLTLECAGLDISTKCKIIHSVCSIVGSDTSGLLMSAAECSWFLFVLGQVRFEATNSQRTLTPHTHIRTTTLTRPPQALTFSVWLCLSQPTNSLTPYLLYLLFPACSGVSVVVAPQPTNNLSLFPLDSLFLFCALVFFVVSLLAHKQTPLSFLASLFLGQWVSRSPSTPHVHTQARLLSDPHVHCLPLSPSVRP